MFVTVDFVFGTLCHVCDETSIILSLNEHNLNLTNLGNALKNPFVPINNYLFNKSFSSLPLSNKNN